MSSGALAAIRPVPGGTAGQDAELPDAGVQKREVLREG
jgi:hypothetical protein